MVTRFVFDPTMAVGVDTGPSLSLSSSGKFYNPGLVFGWEDKEGGGG